MASVTMVWLSPVVALVTRNGTRPCRALVALADLHEFQVASDDLLSELVGHLVFENGRFAARHVRCDGYLVGLGVGQVAGGRFRLLDGHGAEGDALESQLRVLHDALRGHVFAAVKVGGLVLRAVERCGSLWLGQQGFGVFLDEREITVTGASCAFT